MENPSGSIFNYHESCDELRQKLLATTLELENMNNVRRELLNLLKLISQERDEARQELQNLVTKLTSPTMFEVVPSNMMMTKANSSITESNSTSHVSSSVDSLLEAVSPPAEFSNNINGNNVESHINNHNNFGYLIKQKQKRTCDAGDQMIESLLKGKVLPQRGNLLKAVMDSGPLLQTLLVAGPLPTWRNPPPLQNIKIPPLDVKPKPMLDPTMLNVSVVTNSFQMNSNATTSCKNLAPSSMIPQSHHYLLPN